MRMPRAGLAVFLMVAAGPAPAANADGQPPGRQLAETVCLACHGPRGISANPAYPSLAGLPSAYVAKQLGDFKAGRRVNPIMSAMAAGLTPAQVTDLAAYYSALPAAPGANADPALAAAGARLFLGGNAKSRVPACSACHGPDAAGIAPQFPSLAGQQAAYVQTQLQNFATGQRRNDGNAMMRDIAARLSPQETQAVAAYLSGLSRPRQ